MAWLSSPTEIIRSGYEGIFSALGIEAPLRRFKCTSNLYIVAMETVRLNRLLQTALEAAAEGSAVLLRHLPEPELAQLDRRLGFVPGSIGGRLIYR